MQATTVTSDSNHPTVKRFAGFSIRETSGVTADVNFRDSTSGGQLLAVLELAGNESATINFDEVIPVNTGVYVQVTSGSIEGVLYSR